MTDEVRLYRRRIVRLSPSSDSRRDAERAAVRELLAEAFGREVKLLHDTCGRPSVEGFPHFISISHSREEAVLAVSRGCPVGVDVETWRDALVATAAKWLTPTQLAHMHADIDYLRAWTAKEAVYKAIPEQPPGLMGIPLAHLGEESLYEVCWEGGTEGMVALALPVGRGIS